ncbi:nad dependent epimerase dehydratase family [Fusarium albosuccineum]|uniref:Nad dependent epimerase dehydratase family n=1 Tax=Fusarium albosuccineum TaxID=1237068 RepID=A0A8H4PFB2_9HYPO|nr:nad dependent epimerase dehydratase family [Fusarium albosuccineum]
MTTVRVSSGDGLYGLPVHPETPEYQDLTAIVTGANGLTGGSMVKLLSSLPTRWKHVYCLSRRPPSEQVLRTLGPDAVSRITTITCDFLADPESLARTLSQAIPKVDYTFYFTYMQPQSDKAGLQGQWSNAEALTEANSKLLSNFLDALSLSNLIPKRFLLQTGAKHYGFHYGPATNPSFESDPRVTLESNFYYPQEDLLFEFCQKHSISWNVVRPSFIIGTATDSALNHLVGLSVYAAVQAHLGQPLEFPGDYATWDREHCQSTAMLNARMEEWAVLSPNTANEAFNMQDGNPYTWGRLWPYLASWYGAEWNPPTSGESRYKAIQGTYEVPPRGYGHRGTSRYSFTFYEWSQKSEVEKAWKELAKIHKIQFDPFHRRDITFGHADAAVLGGWPLSLSMRKARRLGWFGFADSYHSVFTNIWNMANLGLLVPPAQTEWEETE